MLKRICWILATGGGVGHVPWAPGTFGSLLGLPLGIVFHNLCGFDTGFSTLKLTLAVLLLCAATALAWFSIHITAVNHLEHDDQRIVIDEIVSQALAVMFTPVAWPFYVAGFILFRLFDITKPGPVGWADRKLTGAWGILTDDLIAGAVTALILAAANVALS